MTGKRFTLSRVALNNPNAIRDDKELLTQKEVVDKLNGLYCSNLKLLKSNDFLLKENEKLKSRIKELEIMNEAQSDAIDGLQETMCHLDLSELNGDRE